MLSLLSIRSIVRSVISIDALGEQRLHLQLVERPGRALEVPGNLQLSMLCPCGASLLLDCNVVQWCDCGRLYRFALTVSVERPPAVEPL